MRVHLDTDLGGDPDDACALALLLAWPGVEIVGITTNLDPGGYRAGCVNHYLKLAGRCDIPVMAGAPVTLTSGSRYLSTAGDPRYWPEPIIPAPSPPGAAMDLLSRSIDRGAQLIAIGAATNLAQLEVEQSGSLEQVPIIFMGGWVLPPADGLPAWGPDKDWNVQCDTRAAEILANAANLTLVTLPACLKAHLRATHLSRLRASGPIGELLSAQSTAHAEDNHMDELARTHAALPDDLLNFHYDPVTCAVALQWSGAAVEEMRLKPVLANGLLRFQRNDAGPVVRVVTDVQGDDFAEMWLARIESLHGSAQAIH